VLAIEGDGEMLGETPLEVTVVPHALSVVVPGEKIACIMKKLFQG